MNENIATVACSGSTAISNPANLMPIDNSENILSIGNPGDILTIDNSVIKSENIITVETSENIPDKIVNNVVNGTKKKKTTNPNPKRTRKLTKPERIFLLQKYWQHSREYSAIIRGNLKYL